MEPDELDLYGQGRFILLGGPRPSFILYDGFGSADNTAIPGKSLEQGSALPATWSTGTADNGSALGTWICRTARAAQTDSLAGANFSKIYAESGVSDCTVKVTIAIGTSNGIVVRLSDTQNFIRCAYGASNEMYIVKVAAGSGTVLAGPSGAGAGTAGTHKVVVSGNTITFTAAGGTSLSVSTTFNNTATKHGITDDSGGGNYTYDDFTVTP